MNLLSAVLSLAAISSTSAAPAGKFAANWNDDEAAILYPIDGTASTELLATIKPPGGKSLLIGLSGEINILTTTAVTATNKKGRESAEADGTVEVTVKYAPTGTMNMCNDGVGEEAAPGKVTLSSRRQELSAELNLDCEITGDDTDSLGCIVEGDLYISLELETTAAHHFNFIATDLAPIDYDVVACFDLSGSTATTEGGEASGYVAVQKRMLTLQQVQVAQNGVVINV